MAKRALHTLEARLVPKSIHLKKHYRLQDPCRTFSCVSILFINTQWTLVLQARVIDRLILPLSSHPLTRKQSNLITNSINPPIHHLHSLSTNPKTSLPHHALYPGPPRPRRLPPCQPLQRRHRCHDKQIPQPHNHHLPPPIQACPHYPARPAKRNHLRPQTRARQSPEAAPRDAYADLYPHELEVRSQLHDAVVVEMDEQWVPDMYRKGG